MNKSTTDLLQKYREKRTASMTPEPFGGTPVVVGSNQFVVQKHHARNLHWDLRLEMNGVLVSWAVPKGPSANPADKRLAMHTEDHPLEYVEFEGVIPDGQYGAGPMIVWDRGVWVAKEDIEEGFRKGKLLFELHGFKLHGVWTLIHTPRSGENHWLLIKERDGHVDERGTEAFPDDSIYSGLTVEELRAPEERIEALVERMTQLGSPAADVPSRSVKVMKATRREAGFTDDEWVFEIKYDGYRLVAARENGKATLWSRNGNDLTDSFPEIGRAVRGMWYEGMILDGEVVVHDEQGLPSFSRLQKRGRLQRRTEILQAAVQLPATYYAFDLLALEGHDLRGLPLLERKALLEELLPSAGPLRYSDHIPAQGEAMFRQATAMRIEGIVAKRAASPYVGRRSTDWYKIRTVQSDEFVVVGFTEPKGSRSGLGSIHVAQYRDGELTYSGSVGSGFSQDQLEESRALLEDIERPETPCTAGPTPKGGAHHWVEPVLVAEVQFKEFTDDGQLRHPVFVGFRDDKEPMECVREAGGTRLEEPLQVTDTSLDREVPFTNLDKVFWPDKGYTKGDLIEYHRQVAPWLLPFLRDRPLVMTRYPDGITGKSFFQKNAPGFAPEWCRTETIYSEGSERDLVYFVADDLESLLYVTNMGTIPIHIWSSRADSLGQPDWCILDLDPKEAPFGDVIRVARALKKLADDIGLPSYVKTSGSSGLHVLIPLGRQVTYEQSRTLGELLARVISRELPDIATIARQIGKRDGKVYVDYVQNGHGRLLVSPFTVRALPGAPVSMPLRWSEVKQGLTIEQFHIKNAPARMKRLGENPNAPLLDERPDLLGALEKLMGWFD